MLHLLNLLDQPLLIQSVERHIVVAELEDYAPEAPDVGPVVVAVGGVGLVKLVALESGLGQYFRALVQQRSHVLQLGLPRLTHACYTKVANLNSVVLALQENVAGLEVAMDHVPRVQVVDAKQYLEDEALYARLRQLETVLILEVRFEVAAVAVLRENAQYLAPRIVKVVLLLANERVPEALDHGDFVDLVGEVAWVAINDLDLLHC